MKGKNMREWRNAPSKGTKVPGTPCVPMKTPQAMEAWNLGRLVSTSPKVNLNSAEQIICKRLCEYRARGTGCGTVRDSFNLFEEICPK